MASSLLSDAELSAMRAMLNRSLPDSATIQRPSQTSDGMGGVTTTWTDTATVACRVAPLVSAEEATQGDQTQARAQWMLTLPAGTEVRVTDRIAVGSRIFEVVASRGGRSWALSCRVLCLEVQ